MADFKFEPICELAEGKIAISKMTGNGQTYFRITKQFKTESGSYAPTKTGVSIPADQLNTLYSVLGKFIADNGIEPAKSEKSNGPVEDNLDLIE